MSTEVDLVGECIGIMRDMRRYREIRGLITETSPEGIQTFDLLARPIEGSAWKVVKQDGEVVEYDPSVGMTWTRSGHREVAAGLKKFSFPAKLAYPEKFSLWGGNLDTWRLAGAVEHGDEIALSFDNKESDEWSARLIFSRRRGLCVAYEEARTDTGATVCRMEFTRIDYPFEPA